jgi:uncharacterized protein YndB with AHSA1/START domain
MKTKKAKDVMFGMSVGDRVAGRLNPDNHDPEPSAPYGGKITAITEDGEILVKWDDEWMNRNPKIFMATDLQPELSAKEEYTRLEEEFKQLNKELQAKMTEAGNLIKDAAKLAEKHGKELVNMFDACGPLLSAMDQAGWQTSSLGC